MASIGQIIFWSMIVLIFAIAGFIIVILAIAFSVSQGNVVTDNPFPLGNIGEDVLLDCHFQTKTGTGSSDGVLITWQKEDLTGVVYQYKNNVAQLQDQNPQFRDRALLFSSAISTGNASLLLRSVKMEDAGMYVCSVNAPGASGKVSMNLRVGAFSAPTVNRSNTSLTAKAPRWLPKPDVTWLNQNGNQLNSSTEFISGPTGALQVVSNLQDPVNEETYTCVIQNFLVKAHTEATVQGDEVLTKTYFIFANSSTEVITSPHITALLILLCTLVW